MREFLGNYWNDKEMEVYKIENRNIVINNKHWNGEVYDECFELAENLIDVINNGITVMPLYKQVDENNFEITDYIIK